MAAVGYVWALAAIRHDPLWEARYGRGCADPTGGSGLVGLTDRIEALGGGLSVHSPPGVGTALEVVLPLTAPRGPELPTPVPGRPDDTVLVINQALHGSHTHARVRSWIIHPGCLIRSAIDRSDPR